MRLEDSATTISKECQERVQVMKQNTNCRRLQPVVRQDEAQAPSKRWSSCVIGHAFNARTASETKIAPVDVYRVLFRYGFRAVGQD